MPGGSGDDRPSEGVRQNSPELPLSVALEGEDRLRQFFPVDPGSHDRKEDRTVRAHERGRGGLRPEGIPGQETEAALTACADGQVLPAAADALYGQRQSQNLRRCPRKEVRGLQEPLPVFTAVPGGPCRLRQPAVPCRR